MLAQILKQIYIASEPEPFIDKVRTYKQELAVRIIVQTLLYGLVAMNSSLLRRRQRHLFWHE